MTGINSLSRRRDATNGVRRPGSVEVRDTSARFLASGVSDGSPAEIEVEVYAVHHFVRAMY